MLQIEKLLNFYTCKSGNNTIAVVRITDNKYTVYKNRNFFYITENEYMRTDEVSSTNHQSNQQPPNRTIRTINQHTVECWIENKPIATVHLSSISTDVFINNQGDSFEIIDAGEL